MDRRNFLKLGVMSSAALTATSLTASLTGCSESLPSNSTWKCLRPGDIECLQALAPVMLKGSLPEDKSAHSALLEPMLRYIDSAIHNLHPHTQKQLVDLFNLLNFGLSRGLTTGIWSRWSQTSEEEIEQFLQSWRESSISLFNMAYNGLNKILVATWYGQPESWARVGYPGPPHGDLLISKPS